MSPSTEETGVSAAGPQAGLTVRKAVRADLLEVFRIEKQSFPQPWPYAAFERFLDTPGFLVADDSGDVVGYIVADTVSNHGGSIGHIKDIAVAPNRRGEGIGQTLLSRGLTELFSQGVGRVKLEVRESNERARTLYEAFDFQLHHIVSNYYDNGENAHVLVRNA